MASAPPALRPQGPDPHRAPQLETLHPQDEPPEHPGEPGDCREREPLPPRPSTGAAARKAPGSPLPRRSGMDSLQIVCQRGRTLLAHSQGPQGLAGTRCWLWEPCPPPSWLGTTSPFLTPHLTRQPRSPHPVSAADPPWPALLPSSPRPTSPGVCPRPAPEPLQIPPCLARHLWPAPASPNVAPAPRAGRTHRSTSNSCIRASEPSAHGSAREASLARPHRGRSWGTRLQCSLGALHYRAPQGTFYTKTRKCS